MKKENVEMLGEDNSNEEKKFSIKLFVKILFILIAIILILAVLEVLTTKYLFSKSLNMIDKINNDDNIKVSCTDITQYSDNEIYKVSMESFRKGNFLYVDVEYGSTGDEFSNDKLVYEEKDNIILEHIHTEVGTPYESTEVYSELKTDNYKLSKYYELEVIAEQYEEYEEDNFFEKLLNFVSFSYSYPVFKNGNICLALRNEYQIEYYTFGGKLLYIEDIFENEYNAEEEYEDTEDEYYVLKAYREYKYLDVTDEDRGKISEEDLTIEGKNIYFYDMTNTVYSDSEKIEDKFYENEDYIANIINDNLYCEQYIKITKEEYEKLNFAENVNSKYNYLKISDIEAYDILQKMISKLPDLSLNDIQNYEVHILIPKAENKRVIVKDVFEEKTTENDVKIIRVDEVDEEGFEFTLLFINPQKSTEKPTENKKFDESSIYDMYADEEQMYYDRYDIVIDEYYNELNLTKEDALKKVNEIKDDVLNKCINFEEKQNVEYEYIVQEDAAYFDTVHENNFFEVGGYTSDYLEEDSYKNIWHIPVNCINIEDDENIFSICIYIDTETGNIIGGDKNY